MKKPLAIVMAVLTVLLALPPGWADDTPNPSATFAQLTAVLQGEGWKFDTDKKVFTKDGKTLYVQGDGSVVATPPSQQKPPPAPEPAKAGLKTNPVPPAGDSHLIGPKSDGSTLSQIAHNHLTWMAGGALVGGLVCGLLGGPIGFLVGAIGGMIMGAIAHHLIMEKK